MIIISEATINERYIFNKETIIRSKDITTKATINVNLNGNITNEVEENVIEILNLNFILPKITGITLYYIYLYIYILL
jgi:hypothetical protein